MRTEQGDLGALREKAERNGRREAEDGPVWELPSWATVRALLDAYEELAQAARPIALQGGPHSHPWKRDKRFPQSCMFCRLESLVEKADMG